MSSRTGVLLLGPCLYPTPLQAVSQVFARFADVLGLEQDMSRIAEVWRGVSRLECRESYCTPPIIKVTPEHLSETCCMHTQCQDISPPISYRWCEPHFASMQLVPPLYPSEVPQRVPPHSRQPPTIGAPTPGSPSRPRQPWPLSLPTPCPAVPSHPRWPWPPTMPQGLHHVLPAPPQELQIGRYVVGQEYTPHHDFSDAGRPKTAFHSYSPPLPQLCFTLYVQDQCALPHSSAAHRPIGARLACTCLMP